MIEISKFSETENDQKNFLSLNIEILKSENIPNSRLLIGQKNEQGAQCSHHVYAKCSCVMYTHMYFNQEIANIDFTFLIFSKLVYELFNLVS